MISVIVPTLNEERIIGRTLDELSGQGGDFEILVSDGDSTDRTRSIVRERAGVREVVGPPGRARQLNRGAAAAGGDLLLFLHADTCLPDGAILGLNALERVGAPVAGGFPHRYSHGGPLIRLASMVHSLRSRLTAAYYGDQAPFVSRTLFEAIGGFDDVPVMEDVDFAWRVRRHVRPLRMKEPVVNSPRKLEARGVLRCGAEALYLLACFRLGRVRHLGGHPYFMAVR